MYQYNQTIHKMINSDDVTKDNKKERNPNWPKIPHYPYIYYVRF